MIVWVTLTDRWSRGVPYAAGGLHQLSINAHAQVHGMERAAIGLVMPSRAEKSQRNAATIPAYKGPSCGWYPLGMGGAGQRVIEWLARELELICFCG